MKKIYKQSITNIEYVPILNFSLNFLYLIYSFINSRNFLYHTRCWQINNDYAWINSKILKINTQPLRLAVLLTTLLTI